jgi:hypothetical protein
MAKSEETTTKTSAPKFAPDDPNRFLKPEVAEKYKVVNWVGNEAMVFPNIGTINLKELTAQQAAGLVRRGFKKIVKK